MNCQEFEELVVELARGRETDEGARERGLAHSDSCARCAARLAAERTLCAGLRAARTEESAPPRVEAALLAAFRARRDAAAFDSNHATSTLVSAEAATTRAPNATPQASQTASAEAVSNVRSFEDAAARRASHASLEASRASRSSNWWLRVAAAVLVTVTAGMTARLVWKSESQAEVRLASVRQAQDALTNESRAVVSTGHGRLAVAPEASPAMLTEAGDPDAAPSTSPSYKTVLMPDATAGEEDPREATPAAEGRRPPTASRHAARGRGASQLSRSALGALVANSRSDGTSEAEITTDYFPLSDASAMPSMDGGHVVRVELPRAALLSFGLPVNAEQTSGRVKADVLIGHDGVARAIRFVR